MTDAEAYESYHARQDEESYRRQLFLLGAACANHQVADKLSKGSFADCVFGDALEALKGRRIAPDVDYACVARELGLPDYEKSNKPIDLLRLVAKHCRADAELQATIRGAMTEFLKLEWTRHKGVVEKQAALAHGKRLAAGMHKAFEGLGNEAASMEQHSASGNEASPAEADEARR